MKLGLVFKVHCCFPIKVFDFLFKKDILCRHYSNTIRMTISLFSYCYDKILRQNSLWDNEFVLVHHVGKLKEPGSWGSCHVMCTIRKQRVMQTCCCSALFLLTLSRILTWKLGHPQWAGLSTLINASRSLSLLPLSVILFLHSSPFPFSPQIHTHTHPEVWLLSDSQFFWVDNYYWQSLQYCIKK